MTEKTPTLSVVILLLGLYLTWILEVRCCNAIPHP